MTARTQALLPLWTHLTVTLCAILDSTRADFHCQVVVYWPSKAQNQQNYACSWTESWSLDQNRVFVLSCVFNTVYLHHFVASWLRKRPSGPEARQRGKSYSQSGLSGLWQFGQPLSAIHSLGRPLRLAASAGLRKINGQQDWPVQQCWVVVTVQRDTCSLNSPLFIEVQEHLCLSSS